MGERERWKGKGEGKALKQLAYQNMYP